MKKIFLYMAMAASVLALSACNGKDNPDNPNTPDEPDQPAYVAPITIDGDFSDWAKLDAGKVTTVNCAASATKTDLKSMKVYYDEYYMFIYAEFDFTPYDNAPETAVFNVMLNGDNNTATGGYLGDWDQGETPCIDLMCQGSIIDAGEVCDYDPGQYAYSGAPNTNDWAWDDVSVSGFITGKGSKKAFEIAITRELYPLGKLSDELTLGL